MMGSGMIIRNHGGCMEDVKKQLLDLKKIYQERMDNAKSKRDEYLQYSINNLKNIVKFDEEYDEYEEKLEDLEDQISNISQKPEMDDE